MNNQRNLCPIVLLALLTYGIMLGCQKSQSALPEQKRQGHTMTEWLGILGTNQKAFGNPLTILTITNDAKLNNVEFEVPVSYALMQKYDFLEKNGRPHLILGQRVLNTYYSSSTNGTLVLGCDKDDFDPGTNHVQVQLSIFTVVGTGPAITATGPPADFVASNTYCVHKNIMLDYSTGMIILWGELSISNAVFSFELLDTNLDHIKTIPGVTTNGTINERWNLTGSSGKHYTYDSFSAVYHVLPTNFSSVSLDKPGTSKSHE